MGFKDLYKEDTPFLKLSEPLKQSGCRHDLLCKNLRDGAILHSLHCQQGYSLYLHFSANATIRYMLAIKLNWV